LNRLGWGNIDKRFTQKNLTYTNIKASIANYDASITYRVYLLVPRFRVLLNVAQEGGLIKVNDGKEQYGLSIYDDTQLVVLGFKDKSFFFGETKFVADDDLSLTVKMQNTTLEDFELLLQTLDK
ncbi:MAG: hypothetical protein AAF734_01280, partial [Bacteroidota bacterium]